MYVILQRSSSWASASVIAKNSVDLNNDLSAACLIIRDIQPLATSPPVPCQNVNLHFLIISRQHFDKDIVKSTA
ncbi:hypothetical protein KIN20_016890 [Parelaphostrongylus tenuis]|uniref:Uncharacterized protein n=1 Tax=Parelaphostrongylus tenuis TaxID=148309 RepID=A0AAD5MZ91_PARTN|nr:hypothetical protein KIN20_016890 [Parelaphostrongylus tenuis]